MKAGGGGGGGEVSSCVEVCGGALLGGVNWIRLLVRADTIFLAFLPLILYDAGYSLRKGMFFRNMSSIVTFAVIGTLISAGVVGGGLYVLTKLGWIPSLTTLECALLGALLSAVDPVATLAIFQVRGFCCVRLFRSPVRLSSAGPTCGRNPVYVGIW